MQLQLQQHFDAKTIHTGQHYDENMSRVFFEQLQMPRPDYLFDLGGVKSQSEQTGIMMTRIDEVCQAEKPDALLIYGDTNSTLAAALVAAKLHIPQIHVEAGLRSYNREMPEEINRIVADEFAHLLFCPTEEAVANLAKEGITHERIFRCGDVMCDMLQMMADKVSRLYPDPYYFVTIHRPYNTDDPERLSRILQELNNLDQKVILPVHPRTLTRMQSFSIDVAKFGNLLVIPPIGYIESLSYQKFASAVITDSGGMQKEAYMLQKKCITLRSETEWTETLKNGWNTLCFDHLEEIPQILKAPVGEYYPGMYGDGHAAEEIVRIILKNV